MSNDKGSEGKFLEREENEQQKRKNVQRYRRNRMMPSRKRNGRQIPEGGCSNCVKYFRKAKEDPYA